ncbi:MAG TPA: hypothetical protein VHD32_16330 [Candidatus Didemnitutus sp.]|nr:hypothetical protein [Candidatus Didemnitutus sp.]
MTDEAIIAELTHGGSRVEDYVLVGREGERLSICTGDSRRGLAALLVEEEAAHDACVAFLKRRGARRYSNTKEFAHAVGLDGGVRANPSSQ